MLELSGSLMQLQLLQEQSTFSLNESTSTAFLRQDWSNIVRRKEAEFKQWSAAI
jgi:hypothetical protein